MIYTYFDIEDSTVFDVLKLHKNPFIRDKYLKKVFPIKILNLPNLKKYDKIRIIQKCLEKKIITESHVFVEYAHDEVYLLDVIKVSKNGDVFVKFHEWYDYSFIGDIKRFFRKIKNKLLMINSWEVSEKENYNHNKEEELIDELEKMLGLKDVIKETEMAG